MSMEVRQELIYIPAELKVRKHVQYVYSCRPTVNMRRLKHLLKHHLCRNQLFLEVWHLLLSCHL